MPISVNAQPLGRFQSRVTAQTVSTSPASLEVVTVNHGLGRTPDKCRPILRCIRASISSYPDMVYLQANASVALFLASSGLGQVNADWDFDCEVVHTMVR